MHCTTLNAQMWSQGGPKLGPKGQKQHLLGPGGPWCPQMAGTRWNKIGSVYRQSGLTIRTTLHHPKYQNVLIACIPSQSCSTLFQPFWGTLDNLDPINAVFDPFDPVWDLPGTTFWYLGWCNVVRMVSPDCLYTVPILFHLVPAIWGHHGPMDPINAVLGHF